MRNFLLICLIVFLSSGAAVAQQCAGNIPFPKFNTTPTLITAAGTDGNVGAKYKYTNVLTSPNVDAIVEIEEKVNVSLFLIDNNAVNADRFQPRISPSPALGNSSQSGYYQWKISFVVGGTNTPFNIVNLNFTLYDIDGSDGLGNNNQGYFRETGWLTGQTTANANNPTEVTTQSNVISGIYTFLKINGSGNEHTGVSSDPEVAVLATYANTNFVRFRHGYDFNRVPGGNFDAEYREYAAEFKCFIFPSPGPLPLSFRNFSVALKNQRAMLNWSTFDEVNIEKFAIERSANGVDFETIGIALPNGGQGRVSNYVFPDNISSLGSAPLYYRIRAYDLDGRSKLSSIISIRPDGKQNGSLTVNPVPARESAVLRLQVAEAGTAQVRMIDMNGRVVFSRQQLVNSGLNMIALNNLSAFGNGSYTVQVLAGKEVYNSKLVIVQ